MKKLNKLVVALLSSMSLLSNDVVLASDPMIESGDKVVIGFDDTFAPFGFRNDQDEIVGFDIDLATEIFGRMDVEFEFQPIDWSTKETELSSGNIDMIWNGYTITPEREKLVLFSIPYFENRQIILVKEESDINSKSDLEGKVVATQAESSSLEGILKDEAFISTIDGGEPITYATFVEVFEDLDNGRADAIVVDETLATYFLAQKGEAAIYRILEDDFGEESYAVGFRKSDQAFVTQFNAVLSAVQEDGTFKEIKNQWFKSIEE